MYLVCSRKLIFTDLSLRYTICLPSMSGSNDTLSVLKIVLRQETTRLKRPRFPFYMICPPRTVTINVYENTVNVLVKKIFTVTICRY